jgi:hypothetical protein
MRILSTGRESCCVFYFAIFTAFPLPQQFSLNCCCATPCRSKHGELLRRNRLFGLFAAVVKSPIFPIFRKTGRLKLTNLQHFSPIVTEGNACGMTSVKRWVQSAIIAHLPLTTLPPILPFVVANFRHFRQLAFVVFVAICANR